MSNPLLDDPSEVRDDLGVCYGSDFGSKPIKDVEEFCKEIAMFPVITTRDLELKESYSDDPDEDVNERSRVKRELEERWQKITRRFKAGADTPFEQQYRCYILMEIKYFPYMGWYLKKLGLDKAAKIAQQVRGITPLKYAALQQQQRESEGDKTPAPLKKQIRLVRQGVVTDRGLNFATCSIDKNGVQLFEIKGMDYRTRWILDCLSDKFMKADKYWNLKHKQEPLLRPEDGEEFKRAGLLTIVDNDTRPMITLTDTEIKRTLGLSKTYPNRKIREIVKGCRKATLEGKIKLLYENGHRREITVWGSLFSDIIEVVDSNLPPQEGVDPDHRVRCSFTFGFGNTSGLVFLSNLRQGKFTVLPKEFYQLPGGSQNIYRYLSNFHGMSHLGIRQLANIAGFEEKDVTQLKGVLARSLNTLKAKGFIRHWELGKGRGEAAAFHIALVLPSRRLGSETKGTC